MPHKLSIFTNGESAHVLDGLFTQANFGIVTRMTVWLMAKPEAVNYYFIGLSKPEGMAELVGTFAASLPQWVFAQHPTRRKRFSPYGQWHAFSLGPSRWQSIARHRASGRLPAPIPEI